MKKVGEYLKFHFIQGPREIVRMTANFLIFFWHYFSVGLLARTLFSPWKRIYVPKTISGFRPDEWFNRVTFNLISRTIGAFIRSFVILTGLLVCCLAVLLSCCLVFFWFFSLPGTLAIFLLKEAKKGDIQSPFKLNQFLKLKFTGTPLATVSVEDKEEVTRWFERNEKQKAQFSRFWELDNLLVIPGIGKDWAAGYTLTLDQYTADLAAPQYYSSHLVGRQKETKRIEEVLSGMTKRGCLLVGEPGVGKQTMVENFAKKSQEGRTLPALERKRVLLFHLSSLLGEAKTKDEARQRVLEILEEAGRAGNVILTIDNFDQVVTSQEDRIDLTPVFIQAMDQIGLAIIGLTTPDNFAKFIFPNQKILQYFEKIEVAAPNSAEALIILEDILPFFESKTGVVVTFPALKEIIKLSGRWVIDIPFPEKAIELLDDCLVNSQGKKQKYLQPEDVCQVLAEKTKIPLTQLTRLEREKIEQIEEILHRRVIDQEQAITEIAKALRRKKAGVTAGGRPIGAFLFLGPTGVGKTETAKTLAEALFGSEKQMIRLDMAQFEGEEAAERLIGSFAKKEPGILTSAVRENPYAVLLLDEIEKANLKVQHLFLTAVDEGYLADAFGKKVNFENLLIIGTSNAGAEFIREKLTSSPDTLDTHDTYPQLSSDLVDFVLRQGLFSPEFINRFDAVVVYQPLGLEELLQIARLQLEQLNQRLAEKKISLEITDEMVEKIAHLGFDPVFGARPMKRVIADKVEDVIAKRLLAGEIKRGERIKIEI